MISSFEMIFDLSLILKMTVKVMNDGESDEVVAELKIIFLSPFAKL